MWKKFGIWLAKVILKAAASEVGLKDGQKAAHPGGK